MGVRNVQIQILELLILAQNNVNAIQDIMILVLRYVPPVIDPVINVLDLM